MEQPGTGQDAIHVALVHALLDNHLMLSTSVSVAGVSALYSPVMQRLSLAACALITL